MSNHYVRHDRLPPATVRSDAGEPLHGWATELLPILDQAGIYREIDHGKPWDHPDNGQATHVVVEVFQNPGVRDRAWYRGGQRHRVDEQGYGLIHYAGNEHVLRDGTSLALEEIDDGLGSTLLIGEINAGFSPWAKPANVRDPALGFGNDAARFGSPYEGIVQFLFCDGSVRPINADVDPAVLKALATPNGGEELPPNW